MEEKLPALIQKMLVATIERNPPIFPWEREADDERNRAKSPSERIAYLEDRRPLAPQPDK